MKKKSIAIPLRQYSMVIVLVFISILFHILTKGLIFTPLNMTNIVLQNSYIVILIMGMLPIILTGNIDLSVGSLVGFIGAIAATLQVRMAVGFVPTLIISLLAGALIGAWTGFWVAYGTIPAFIATLSGQLVFRGLTNVILNGTSIGPFSPAFRAMASSFIPDIFRTSGLHITTMVLAVVICIAYTLNQIWSRRKKSDRGITVKPIGGTIAKTVIICLVILFLSYEMATYQGYPTVLAILAVLSLAYSFICNRTVFGRGLYAIGGNRKAAALSGIKDRKVLFLTFVNMGVMAAMSALVYASRLNAGTSQSGCGF